jgi:DNA-binding transcriptional MerR regulator
MTTRSVGEVADATGLSPATLRAWERRYGFPAPERLPGGHRRYPAGQVQLLLEVVRWREHGLPLPSAIARALDRSEPNPSPSLFAALRAADPGRSTTRVTVVQLEALSRAIEDEVMARAEPVTVFGAFQHVAAYERARPRWTELARVARSVTVFADFATSATGPPCEVPLAIDAPVAREWAVICDGPAFSVALVAWEIPGPSGSSGRAFESRWSLDQLAVRTVARRCIDLVVDPMPELAERLRATLDSDPPRATRREDALQGLIDRVVGYTLSGPDRLQSS